MTQANPSTAPCADDVQTAQKHVADLRAVLAVTRELVATGELTPLLEKVERAARSVLECERATVFLYDQATNELYSRMATGVEEIRFSADKGIAGEVARSGEVIDVPDAYADSRFNPEIDRKTGFRTRNLLTFPLVGIDRSIVGVLQVLNKSTGSFDPWDHELVQTFGAQVGVALQRQLLLEHYAEKQRLERDLSIAREIQQGLIPDRGADVANFDVAGWNRPADETGGDCYDYLTLDDGSLAIIIADATGHGIGPALMIAECRALFRATISMSRNLSEVVGRINDLLCDDLPDDRFVTAFFGLLSPEDHTLSFLSAGHGPLVKYVRATDEIVELSANAMPLGIMSGVPFEDPEMFPMATGDMMVLVTDGFFEWHDHSKEQYGMERLYRVLRRNRDRPCADIIDALYRDVIGFAGGTKQADDLTAVIIKRR